MSRFSMDWSELSLQVMVTFGHFLWQACAVGILLAIGEQAFEIVSGRGGGGGGGWEKKKKTNPPPPPPPHSANFRYTIACVAFFSLPICVIATFARVHQSRGPILLVASDPFESLMVSANEAISTMANSDIPVLPPPATPMSVGMPLTEPIEPSTLVVEPHTSPVQRIESFAPYLLLAYMVGVSFMLARFLLSIIGSSRLRRTIQPIKDVSLLRTIAEQCARVGLKRVPLMALCQRVSVPVVVGIVKPMILLPPALLCGLDPNQIAAILSHEIAHIRRHDLVVNLLQRIVEALLFFHPVTWWISRRVSIERENCCDDVAAACMGRLPYAGALLRMAELCIGNDRRRSAALATLSASGSNATDLGYRIRRLIGAEETTRVGVTRRSISIGMTLIALLAVSLVAWGQSQQSANDEQPKGDEMEEVFTPEPLWQTKLAADDVAPETLRLSPVIVAVKRVLSIEKDFDLSTGKEVESTFVRLPRKNVLDMTLDPVFRRTSSDREFLVEVSVHGLGNVLGLDKGWGLSSCDIRVLRATDGGQIGTTIHMSQLFDGITSDVDVENGGDFLVLGVGNEVQVYRTETGEVETTMPVKTRRVDAVAISPDLEWLVVSDQNDLHFWRWRDQAPVKTIPMGRKIDSLVFTPDGQYLAEGPDTREDIQIRDMRTLEVIASLKDEVGSPLMVSSMDITPDGRYLVAHNEVSVDPEKLAIPHRIHVWDLQSRGKPVFQIATGEWVRKMEFSDDGRMIVSEFSGAAHGALLAAWQLPNEIVQRRIDSPIDSKDRLGDGIQWSRFGDENGLLSGARLILPKDGLKPGQPLVVEYRLANVSKETKTLKCYLNKGMQFASLGHGNRISGFGLDREREPVTLTIEPGEVFIDTEHLVSIDTTGLEPGPYHAALGSAFFYPDSVEPNTTHELPHRGSIPFTIVGESAVKVLELPKSDIHWGQPIAGLQVGARFAGDPTAYAIGATIEADLFVANVTDQPIECSVVLPHPGDGWLFNVEDSNGSTIMLQRPMRFSSPFPQEYVQLKLAPGEITVLTKDQDKKDGTPSRPRPKFELADKETEEQGWSDYTVKGRLVTQGGQYSAIFDIVIIRPEIPALRLELDSGNIPFSVVDKEDLVNIAVDDEKENHSETTETQQPKSSSGANAQTDQVDIKYPYCIVDVEDLKTRTLSDAIQAFNRQALENPTGVLQIPITEPETREAIKKYVTESKPTEDIRNQLNEILKTGLLPSNVYFRRFTRLDDEQQMHEVWWVRLVVKSTDAKVCSVPVRTTKLKSRPYTQMERQQNAGGLTLINRFVSYFAEPPNILLLREFPRDAVDRLVDSADKSIKANDANAFQALFDWNGVSDTTKDFVKSEFEMLANSTIHSIKVTSRNFRGELIHWSAYQYYQPNMEIVGYLDIDFTGGDEQRKTLSLEMGEAGVELRLVNYVPKGERKFPEGQIEGLSIHGHAEELADGSLLGSFIITNPGTLISGHVANEEIRQHNNAQKEVAVSPGKLSGHIRVEGPISQLAKIRVPPPKSPRLSKRPTDEELKKFEASLVEIDDESIQVDADQGLANAFVYLAKAPSNWQPTQEDLKPFTLTIQDYRFEPRVAIVRTGQDVRLNNSSVDADNFAFEPMKNDAQNRAVEAGSEITLEHPFTSPEVIPIQAKSQMHPWKTAFLLPLDHPFAAITDSQGKFSIEGLPPGEHQFLIWHERTGWLEKSLVVNIEAGQTKEVNRSYSVDRFRLAANKKQTDVTQQSSAEKPDSSKQSFQLIDGETGKLLQGLKCRAIFAKRNAPPRYQECTTDEHGVVEVAVTEDESAGIAEVPSGWFSNGFGSVFVVQKPGSEQRPQQNAEKKNGEPKRLKLWRGTEVDGRLLWPDKTPAAGVRLTVGVYINHQTWKEKLGMDLTLYSFDHGDWPNWSRTIVTDDDGNFRVTVPPKDARSWLRIGTTQLGFGPQINVGENEAITQRLAKCVPLEIQYGGSSRSNMLIVHDITENDGLVLHAGDLKLETGVIVRGRVVDAQGNGLSNVHLTSTGPHGPHSGRRATSGEDGKFEFPAMAAGNLEVHPDARLRDVTKPIPEQVISRDVQAVFVDQSFAIPSVFLPHEIIVRAVPHTEVTFEWVDRRADKTQPIAFYGAFRVRGHMPDENGKPATYWTSETERNGKQWLTVKIPTQLLKPDLMLAADSKVTASYRDSTGVTSGPGIVELGDISANTTRTIFGDEPRELESTQGDENDK